MKTVIRWQYLVDFILLCAAIVFAVVSPYWLVTNMIQPLALVLWVIVRVFLSVHQSVYWTGLIFLAFFLALRILPPKPVMYKRYPTTDGQAPVNRVDHWCQLIRNAPKNADNDQVLKMEMQALIDEWHQAADEQWASKRTTGIQGTDPFDVNHGSIPASVAAFLNSERETGKDPSYRWKSWINITFARWIRWQTNRDNKKYEDAIEQVVGFIETNMETNINEQCSDSNDC